MELTDIRIYPVEEDKLRAFVSVVVDNCFRITDIKIIQGSSGRFLSMPSKRRNDGSYRDIAHPLNGETRAYFEKLIFERYDTVVGSRDTRDAEEDELDGAGTNGASSDGLDRLAASPSGDESNLPLG